MAITPITFTAITVLLEVAKPCWFYQSEGPVLTCTVHSLEWSIRWRRDYLIIGIDGRPVGDNIPHYNITSSTNNTLRQEKLHVSSSIAESLVEKQSNFRCENQGYSSLNVKLQRSGKSLHKQLPHNDARTHS